MSDWLPLWPEDASTIAGEVDKFAFFLIGMSLFFVAGMIAIGAGAALYFFCRPVQ